MWKPIAVLLVALCAAGALMAPGTASAISFETRDFDALSREADQVVIGTMVATNARRTGEREIVTDYRFDNLEIVKGTVAGSSLTLTMLGGTVGTDSLTVAGAPTFKRGTRYLVFVSGNGSVMFPLVGGPQGIFQMRKDAASGVTRVHDYVGRPVKQLSGLGRRTSEDVVRDDALESITQAQFVEAIRVRAKAGGSAK